MDGILAHGEVLSVKHADGKNWWLITPLENSNTFYILKFTKQTALWILLHKPSAQNPIPRAKVMVRSFFPLWYKNLQNQPIQPHHGVFFLTARRAYLPVSTPDPYVYGNTPVGEIGCAVLPACRFWTQAAQKICINWIYRLLISALRKRS